MGVQLYEGANPRDTGVRRPSLSLLPFVSSLLGLFMVDHPQFIETHPPTPGLLVYRLRIKFDTNYLLLFTYRILYRYFFALHISPDIPINLSINYTSIKLSTMWLRIGWPNGQVSGHHGTFRPRRI